MRNDTLGVVDVVLVIVGASGGHFAAFDDFDGVVFGVPPTAHDASTDLQWKHTRSPLLHRL